MITACTWIVICDWVPSELMFSFISLQICIALKSSNIIYLWRNKKGTFVVESLLNKAKNVNK